MLGSVKYLRHSREEEPVEVAAADEVEEQGRDGTVEEETVSPVEPVRSQERIHPLSLMRIPLRRLQLRYRSLVKQRAK